MSSDISVCHQYISVTMYAYDDMSPDISVCHQYIMYVTNMLVTLYTLYICPLISVYMSPICHMCHQ